MASKNQDTGTGRPPGTPRLRCEYCKRFKDDTAMRIHPVAAELSNDYTEYPLCEECTVLLADEV